MEYFDIELTYHELAVTRPTIYRDYLLAKQRDKRIDDILSD